MEKDRDFTDRKINLLISVDSNYLKYVKVMLYSLCRKTEENISVFLLNQTLNKDELNLLDNFIKNKCNSELTVCNIDDDVFNGLPTDNFPKEAYSRIIAQFVLPNDLDRVLWIDGDIVVLDDISEFYYQDFNNQFYVVCPDAWDTGHYNDWHYDAIKKIKKRMNIDENHIYFNSGVMLMNLEKLREESNLSNLLNSAYRYKDDITYVDQDILNCLYQNKVKYDDWKKFNCQRVSNYKEFNIDYNNVVVLHYTGIRKPWDFKFLDNLSKYYWKEYTLSGVSFSYLEMICFYILGCSFKFIEKIIKLIPGSFYDKLVHIILKK